MWKVYVIGIVAAFLGLSIRQNKSEYSIMIGISAGTIIFLFALLQVGQVIDFIKSVVDKLPIENVYIYQLFKMMGVAYCAEFSSNICKDMGYHSLAGQIETFAKMCILVMSLPGLYYFVEVFEKIW